MSNKLHVRQGDTVYVLTGKDSGKRGKVLKIFTADERILVEGVNMIKKHKKPQQTQPGGIINQEGPVHVSNVMLICDKCKKPARVGKRILENGDKVRYCKKCNEIISTVKKAKS